MLFKTVLITLACTTFVLGFNVNSRVKRATEESTSTTTEENTTERDSITSGDNNTESDSATTDDINTEQASSLLSRLRDNSTSGSDASSDSASQFGDGLSNAASNIGKRLQNAINNTYQEESDSVGSSWNNMKELNHQSIETAANLTKTGFDLGTIIPKFGKHLVINN